MAYIYLSLLGLALGSFVNALVWRLYTGEKAKHNVQTIKKDEARSLSIFHGRSMCVNCRHVLAWYDLIPVVSWLALGGKCRYCKKSISLQYPLIEVLMAFLTLISYIYWPIELSSFLQWSVLITRIIALVPMVALVIYDLRWMEMPTNLIYVLDIISVVFVGLLAISQKDWSIVYSSAIGALLIGGLFWLIYQISGGKWIGGGDVRFGFAMGVLLGWQKAVFGLALASYLGTALIIVLIFTRKYHKKMRLPFGPFLISALYLSMIFGQYAIDWYKNLAGL